MSDSSMATPIAAALVSLLLEVAMNPGVSDARHILEYHLPKMRKYEGIEAILLNASQQRSDYVIIDPNSNKPKTASRLHIGFAECCVRDTELPATPRQEQIREP